MQTANPEISILKVRRAGPLRTHVRGFSVDSPAPGAGPLEQGVKVQGWVAAADVHITGVVIFCGGALLRASPLTVPRPDVAAELPGAKTLCGFRFHLSPMEIPPEFELLVYAVLVTHELVQLATINGVHAPFPPPPPDSLRPLIVTSLGRSGTTYFMRLLSAHPQIVADGTYPYEGNAAAYWLHLFRTLTEPEPPDLVPPPFDGGDWPRLAFLAPPTSRTPPLAHFVTSAYPPIAFQFCRTAIEAFYRQLALVNQQADPVFFCEKFVPCGLGHMAANFYPDGREIILVRDFRDVASSIFAFNAKRGHVSFGRDQVASDEAYIPELRKAAQHLLETFHSRPTRAHLIRYEDLMQRPRQTLRAALEYAGLPHSPEILESLLAAAPAKDAQLKEHRTAPSAEASIGRWKNDLTPAVQTLCRAAFDDLLPKFGYQLDTRGNLLLLDPES